MHTGISITNKQTRAHRRQHYKCKMKLSKVAVWWDGWLWELLRVCVCMCDGLWLWASTAVWPAYRKSNHSHTYLFTLRDVQSRVNCPIKLFISLLWRPVTRRMKRLHLSAAAGTCMTVIGNVIKINQVSSSTESRISANHYNLPEAFTFGGAICVNQLLAGNRQYAFVVNK